MEDSAVERSCRILEDNEVYNNNDVSQSYRILLLDKPVEGKYVSINTSHAGINSLHFKSIDGEALRSPPHQQRSSRTSVAIRRQPPFLRPSLRTFFI